MRFTWRNTCWPWFVRRVGACAALVAYLVAAVGFPVPAVPLTATAGASASGQHACGCPSDQQRQGSCCCCSSHLPACCRKHQPAAQPPAESGLRWVGGPTALGCRGLSTVWIASGAVAPPAASPTWEPFAAPDGWLPPAHDHPFRLPLVPPDPPPRSLPS